jgi:hypothetical protein
VYKKPYLLKKIGVAIRENIFSKWWWGFSSGSPPPSWR